MNLQVQERLSDQAEVVHTSALRNKRKRFLGQNLKCDPVGLTENRGATESDLPRVQSRVSGRVDTAAKPLRRTPPPKTARRPLETSRSEMRSPYVMEVEVNCEECGGSGFDPDGVDPWGPEERPTCHGAKPQRITRNYLAEAFQISANAESIRPVERQHLVAIIEHCRELVGALMSFPEVA